MVYVSRRPGVAYELDGGAVDGRPGGPPDSNSPLRVDSSPMRSGSADRWAVAGLGAQQGDSVVGDLFHAIDSRPVWWMAVRLAIGHPSPALTAIV